MITGDFYFVILVIGTLKCDQIKHMITLTRDLHKTVFTVQPCEGDKTTDWGSLDCKARIRLDETEFPFVLRRICLNAFLSGCNNIFPIIEYAKWNSLRTENFSDKRGMWAACRPLPDQDLRRKCCCCCSGLDLGTTSSRRKQLSEVWCSRDGRTSRERQRSQCRSRRRTWNLSHRKNLRWTYIGSANNMKVGNFWHRSVNQANSKLKPFHVKKMLCS